MTESKRLVDIKMEEGMILICEAVNHGNSNYFTAGEEYPCLNETITDDVGDTWGVNGGYIGVYNELLFSIKANTPKEEQSVCLVDVDLIEGMVVVCDGFTWDSQDDSFTEGKSYIVNEDCHIIDDEGDSQGNINNPEYYFKDGESTFFIQYPDEVVNSVEITEDTEDRIVTPSLSLMKTLILPKTLTDQLDKYSLRLEYSSGVYEVWGNLIEYPPLTVSCTQDLEEILTAFETLDKYKQKGE